MPNLLAVFRFWHLVSAFIAPRNHSSLALKGGCGYASEKVASILEELIQPFQVKNWPVDRLELPILDDPHLKEESIPKLSSI